ncbi:MAG: hypothetical protein GXO21_05365 [Aquificae bacterium]|nr:hypothetical protein [Aquificota bacterium]
MGWKERKKAILEENKKFRNFLKDVFSGKKDPIEWWGRGHRKKGTTKEWKKEVEFGVKGQIIGLACDPYRNRLFTTLQDRQLLYNSVPKEKRQDNIEYIKDFKSLWEWLKKHEKEIIIVSALVSIFLLLKKDR